MSCQRYEELIFRLPDGDLTEAEKAELRSHLRTCGDCRRLCDAMAAALPVLRDDMAEAPAALARGVMDRIYAYEEENAPVPITRGRRPSARWDRYAAIAACLVLILGGGSYIGVSLLGPKGSAAAPAAESITLEAAAEVPEAPAAMAPMPAPEEAPAAGEAMYAAAAEDPMAEAAEAEFAQDMDAGLADAARSQAAYSVDAPASVPAGREAEFEALLADARWPEGEPDLQWHTAAAVEYRGVIYEFLTDDNEQYLLWRDAAEGFSPTHSPGTVAELWDIIG